ncbi:hypothetical protein BDB01DRAFT_840509 [Pilobolus umbonatus]|nr:hypothetical protein BDB01DRAFT_840509 [Pilobolus umbonatus]
MRSGRGLLLALFIPFLVTSPYLVTADKSAQEYLAEGNQYLLSGQFNDAVISYDEAIQRDPSDYLSYYKRATAYLSLGKSSAARDDFTKILDLKPGFERALLERAKLYMSEGELDLAKIDLEDYKKKQATAEIQEMLKAVTYAQQELKLAENSLANDKYEECIRHITEVIQVAPQKSQWRLLRAKCHIGKGEIEEASGDLSRVATLNPSDHSHNIQLAKLFYYSLYEPERAIAQVKQCLYYDPEQKECKNLFKLIKRAEKDLAKIISAQEHQRYAIAFNGLVGSGAKKGLVDGIDGPLKALEIELAAVGKLPRRLHLKYYETACMLAGTMKNAEKLEKWCGATLSIDANHVDALTVRGEHLLNNNDFEAAVRVLEKAFESSGQQNGRVRQLLQKAQQLLRQSKKRDYYKILGVSRDADPRTIKKAYRKLAQEWHPDKYSGDLSSEDVQNKMAEINQAYEVLGDTGKREQFDNGIDPYDPEAQQHQGGNPFAHHGEEEPLHCEEAIEMSEPGTSEDIHHTTHPPLYRKLGRLAEEGWTSVANLVNHPHRRPSTHLDEDDPTPVLPEFSNDWKRKLYLLLEEPSSSRGAFWTNVVVSFLIVFSAVTTTIETIPSFRSTESNKVWFHLESAMVSLFTLEYLLRMFAHSDSFRLLKTFFLCKWCRIYRTYEFRFTILRLFRLLRLFKSYKYSNAIIMTIEVMMMAFRRSGDALSALFFFTVTCVVLFSTLLYFAERGIWDETLETFIASDGTPSSFDSIPAAFWFVLVTITTTGYGDMVPTTFIGKLITFPAMMFGVLLIALPSIIVGRNFTIVWEGMRRRQYSSEYAPNPLGNVDADEHTAANTSFNIIPNGEEEILRQIQLLMTLTIHNQTSINKILKGLESQDMQISPRYMGQNDINDTDIHPSSSLPHNRKGKHPMTRVQDPFNDE